MSYRDTPCRVDMETRAYFAKQDKPGVDIMSDDEIREKVLESPVFASSVAEQILEKVTEQQWAIVANYILSNAKHLRRQADREAEIGRYVLETLLPICIADLKWHIENYKDKNDITYGMEDE